MQQIDFDAPNRIIQQMVDSKEIEMVDVINLLRESRSTTKLYFDIDPHLTPVGHQLVGTALFNHLTSKTESTIFQTPQIH